MNSGKAGKTSQISPAGQSSGISSHEMHGHAPKGSSDTWLFNAEAVSTLLIAAWYVYSVFISLGILPKGGFHSWGGEWIMSFLLGIFYLGAGYLYQQHQRVNSISQWTSYMKREVIVLLTPFLAFTILVLLTGSLTALQPGLVDAGLATAGPSFSLEALVHAIFVDPVIPVGYFIVLLGFFVITRTPRTTRAMGVLLILAVIAKIVAIVLAGSEVGKGVPYYPMHWLDNWIWFVLGIAVSFFKLPKVLAKPGVAVAFTVAFVGLGALLFAFDVKDPAILTVLVLLGLSCFFSLSAVRFLDGKQNAFFGFVTKYTMAIWLMHEIVSKALLCVLFALGFCPGGAFDAVWVPVSAVVVLIACYPLPVLIMEILSKVWKLGFIVYPSRYLPPQKS